MAGRLYYKPYAEPFFCQFWNLILVIELLKSAQDMETPTFYTAFPDYRLPTAVCDLDSITEIVPYRFAKLLSSGLLRALVNIFYIKARAKGNG